MDISDLTLCDFLREKIKLSDNDARDYIKELLLEVEKSRAEQKREIIKENKLVDNASKIDFEEMEVRVEKGFRELTIVVVSLIAAFAALGIAIIKSFSNDF